MAKLTKTFIESLAPKDKDYFVFDDELPGFGVRISKKGKRYYIAQYRTTGTSIRRTTLGMHGIINLQKARSDAFNYIAAARYGKDPIGEAQAQLQQEAEAPLMDELIERFKTNYIPYASNQVLPACITIYWTTPSCLRLEKRKSRR